MRHARPTNRFIPSARSLIVVATLLFIGCGAPQTPPPEAPPVRDFPAHHPTPTAQAPEATLQALAGSWSFDAELSVEGVPEEDAEMFREMVSQWEQTLTFSDANLQVSFVADGETEVENVPISLIEQEGAMIVLLSQPDPVAGAVEELTITFYDNDTIYLSTNEDPPAAYRRQ